MVEASRRFEERYKIALPVRLTTGRRTVHLATDDVSYHGLFLRTDTPPDLRELVRLSVDLPTGVTVTLHGMAVHVVRPGDPRGRLPGVGVQFYAVDRNTLSTWSTMVRELARRRIALAPALAPEEHRRLPRYAAELDLKVRSLDELYALSSRDVSEGGMFIVTNLDLALDEVIQIHVVHPEAGTVFPLDARVCRQQYHPARGLGVEFLDMTPARREAFFEFVRGSIVLDDVWLTIDVPLELSA